MVANYCPAGATVTEIEPRADRFLAGDQVQAVGVAMTGVQYATVAAPRARTAASSTRSNTAAAAATASARTSSRSCRTQPSLSDEQTAMVTQLTTDGAGVSVVVGAAGTGKTHALAVARQVWEPTATR